MPVRCVTYDYFTLTTDTATGTTTRDVGRRERSSFAERVAVSRSRFHIRARSFDATNESGSRGHDLMGVVSEVRTDPASRAPLWSFSQHSRDVRIRLPLNNTKTPNHCRSLVDSAPHRARTYGTEREGCSSAHLGGHRWLESTPIGRRYSPWPTSTSVSAPHWILASRP